MEGGHPGPGNGQPPPLAQLSVIAGLALVAVSLVLPFASNEAGCLDHCADAQRWFVWHPFHNLGAPFLLIGVVCSVVLWRSPAWRRRTLPWLGAACGWIGLFILYGFTPDVIEEMYLYGGPELQLLTTRWLIAFGWPLLWLGSMFCTRQDITPP